MYRLTSKSLPFTHQLSRNTHNLSSYSRHFSARALVGKPLNEITIGVLREIDPEERRVAQVPSSIEKLIKQGYNVQVEDGAGLDGSFSNKDYENVGAKIVSSDEIYNSDVIVKVKPPTSDEIKRINPNSTFISTLYPGRFSDIKDEIVAQGCDSFALDCVPRISRAQSMDILSSMANIAGYKAVIEAANEFHRFFPGQITAAGKVQPAKVLIIGGGVAGLSACGAAKSLVYIYMYIILAHILICLLLIRYGSNCSGI